MFMLYGPFSPVNNVPVPIGLDHEIGYIMKLIALARRRQVTVAPTAAAITGSSLILASFHTAEIR